MILIFAAFAAPPTDAPLALRFDAPTADALRVTLPPDAIGANPETLTTSLVLQDVNGDDIPFTVVTSQRRDAMTSEQLTTVPDGNRWRAAAASRPVEALRVDLDNWGNGVAEVRVDGGPPQIVYQLDRPGGQVVQREVNVPRGLGPFLLDVRLLDGQTTGIRDVQALARAEDDVPAPWVPLELGTPLRTEDGPDRYSIDLGGPRAVQALAFTVEGDLFDRTVRGGVPSERESTPTQDLGMLSRIDLGGARIERTELRFEPLRGDRLLFDVQSDVGRCLPITGLRAQIVGAELLLSHVAAGSYTLYVGGRDHAPSGDLASAKVDLLRIAQPLDLSTAALTPNAAWLPRATEEGADGAGSALLVRTWHWQRAITGAGWVKVMLDRSVLAHARSDLADLRVVDAEDRQLPFAVDQTGLEDAWETAPFTRTEVGSRSRLRIDLGVDAAPLATVRLQTGKDLFARDVTVLVDRGTITTPIRRVRWVGTEAGRTLAIGVNQVVGRELLIEIENGDNPPLPVESVEITSPRAELRVNVPEGGARLLYGAPNQSFPTYDLALLRDDVLTMPTTPATLGEEEVVSAPALQGINRFVVAGAIGVLALGLLGLVIRVVRGAPDPDAPSDAPSDAAAPPSPPAPTA